RLARLSRNEWSRFHRLRPFRQYRATLRPTALLLGEDHTPAGLIHGDEPRPDRGPHPGACRGWLAARGFCVLFVQRKLQDHRAGVRYLDAAAAARRWQCAVAYAFERGRGDEAAA